MLTRSWVAIVCGCAAAVAAYGDDSYRYADQDANQERLLYAELLHDEQPHWRPQDVGEQEHPWPGPPGGHPGPPPRTPPHRGHGFPHPPPKFPDNTIYEVLQSDDRFSRLFKLIKFAEDIALALNDPTSNVTFFAPPDHALRPPPKHKPKHGHFDEVEAFFDNDVIENADKFELIAALEGFVDNTLLNDGDDSNDDEEKEHKKRILKKVVSAVLKYHIIGAELRSSDLGKNTTFPSSLTLGEGSLDGQELRIRVDQYKLIPPSLTVNLYARIIFTDVETKNGIIHVVNHPLFPPPATFQVLFGFFDAFSTLASPRNSSALQRLNLTDAVDWHWDWKTKTLEGSPAVTFFAPTNKAFSYLPKKLKFFLFSPFGAKALKKILSYHIVPDYVFHTNWVHNATDDFLPAGHRNVPAMVNDDPMVWLKNIGCPEEEFDSILDRFDAQEGELDDIESQKASYLEPSRPEAEGYGFIGGEYESRYAERKSLKCAKRGGRKGSRDSKRMRVMRGRSPYPPKMPFPEPGPEHHPFPPPPPGAPPHKPGPGKEHHPLPPPPSIPGGSPPHHPSPPPPPGAPPHHPPEHKRPPRLPHPKPIYTVNATLPTLGSNHTLHVHVAQFHSLIPHRYVTKLFVNHHWVPVPDVPTRNGAIHVVGKLIRPLGHGKHGKHTQGPPQKPDQYNGEAAQSWDSVLSEESDMNDDWEDWEEWLPQWANED
ncbi:FAS1 domain-containing protein [Cytidiella melzeri]|nr:FAS1 domain-containing protein [Cytidiella melzeri]